MENENRINQKTNGLRKLCRRQRTAGRATDVGQILSEVPDKEMYLGPPGWILGMRLTSSALKKLIVTPWQRGDHGRKQSEMP